MTLAIFILSLFLSSSTPHSEAQATQPTETPNPQSAQETQSQAPPANAEDSSKQSSSETPPKPRTGNRTPHTARTHSKKKAAKAVPCYTTPATADQTGSHSQDASADASAPDASSGTTQRSKNCPPPKIVVRQGGTKDPSIQLAGGASDQAAQKRDNINQLLGQTDQNLKKAEGMQLTTSQQEVVTQAQQYVVQSKAAMANGDFERARTLAWKAQLLSQDLASPPK